MGCIDEAGEGGRAQHRADQGHREPRCTSNIPVIQVGSDAIRTAAMRRGCLFRAEVEGGGSFVPSSWASTEAICVRVRSTAGLITIYLSLSLLFFFLTLYEMAGPILLPISLTRSPFQLGSPSFQRLRSMTGMTPTCDRLLMKWAVDGIQVPSQWFSRTRLSLCVAQLASGNAPYRARELVPICSENPSRKASRHRHTPSMPSTTAGCLKS
ncbi:hypothetical protein V8C35DRAFT_36798 [Trichoderma chlorosporum]